MPLSVLLKNPWVQTTLIGAGCLVAYAGIRSVPVEACDFLHYGDYVNAEGIIEGCGFEETAFFDLSVLKYPVLVQVTPLTEPRAGQPVQAELYIQTSTGRPISADEVAVSHTERLHLMAVDTSRDDYRHLHPVPTGAPGTWLVEFTPEQAGEYSLFLDFISLRSGKRTLVAGSLDVFGSETTSPSTSSSRPLPYAEKLTHETATHRFDLLPLDGSFAPGMESRFRLEVTSLDGSEVVFEPVMDSYAHVVAFDDQRRGFAHFHPENAVIATEPSASPSLDFVFRLDHPGHYRIWAQLQLDGTEIFVPFDIVLDESVRT